jgi:hypothetical protein
MFGDLFSVQRLDRAKATQKRKIAWPNRAWSQTFTHWTRRFHFESALKMGTFQPHKQTAFRTRPEPHAEIFTRKSPLCDLLRRFQ